MQNSFTSKLNNTKTPELICKGQTCFRCGTFINDCEGTCTACGTYCKRSDAPCNACRDTCDRCGKPKFRCESRGDGSRDLVALEHEGTHDEGIGEYMIVRLCLSDSNASRQPCKQAKPCIRKPNAREFFTMLSCKEQNQLQFRITKSSYVLYFHKQLEIIYFKNKKRIANFMDKINSAMLTVHHSFFALRQLPVAIFRIR